MTFPDITPDLKAAMPDLRGRLLANEALAPLTWFRVGGPAQVLFTPADEDDLIYCLENLPDHVPLHVVGVGSNLIVRDGGVPGVVIRLSPCAFGEARAEGDIVSAGAAVLDKRVAEVAAAAELGGLEFYYGIPGTIGGALRMNAGANGGETRDVLVEATGIDRRGGRHSRADERGAEPPRDRAADPRKDRGIDLPEPARRQRLETDRCRRLPGLARGRGAGLGNALQFPHQYR